MAVLLNGYTGLFKQPLIDIGVVTTGYAVTNIEKNTLVMILLTPESFSDAYRICSHLKFSEVVLIVPSVDVLFISDIFNLIMLLRKIKPDIKWVYPERPKISTSVEFELHQNLTDKYILDGYGKFNNFDTSFEFIRSNLEDRVFYDILVNDGERSIMLCQYMDIDKLNKLNEDITIDEIHMAYSSTLYGGMNYNDIVNINPILTKKIYVHSFTSKDEYKYCTDFNRVKVGRVIYNDLI